MTVALHRRLDAACRIAERAAALALRLRPATGAASGTLKSACPPVSQESGDGQGAPRQDVTRQDVARQDVAGQDWLTEADGAVEALLSEALLDAFPEDGFQGEEAGARRDGRLRWVVDPIDGTANYARGGARWCVSVGLLEGATPLLGVLAAPACGEVFAAVAGGGATLNGAAIRAAATTRLDRATIECGWSPAVRRADYLALAARVMGTGALLRAGGSGALGLADVACGRLDGYVERHIHLWDLAAALAILAEAGAVEHGFMASGGPRDGGPILAAAPGIAVALRAAAA